jgi:hypothetical protein
MSEAGLQTSLIDAARWQGWLVYHPLPCQLRGRQLTAYQGDKGFPDLVLVHPQGGILFRELKAEGAYPTPDQRKWLARIEQAAAVGASAAVWRPRDQRAALDTIGGLGLWR